MFKKRPQVPNPNLRVGTPSPFSWAGLCSPKNAYRADWPPPKKCRIFASEKWKDNCHEKTDSTTCVATMHLSIRLLCYTERIRTRNALLAIVYCLWLDGTPGRAKTTTAKRETKSLPTKRKDKPMRKTFTENPSRLKCDHLFIHLPLAEFKWKCVKCGAKVRRRNYRNLIYSSTAAKEQEQTDRENQRRDRQGIFPIYPMR